NGPEETASKKRSSETAALARTSLAVITRASPAGVAYRHRGHQLLECRTPAGDGRKRCRYKLVAVPATGSRDLLLMSCEAKVDLGQTCSPAPKQRKAASPTRLGPEPLLHILNMRWLRLLRPKDFFRPQVKLERCRELEQRQSRYLSLPQLRLSLWPP